MVRSLVLSVLWVLWCGMHSALIDPVVADRIKNRFPEVMRYYRLLYNGLSLSTFVPLMLYTRGQGGAVVFGWQGWGEMLRMLLLLFALVLFWRGAKRYDLRFFLGLDQLASGKATVLLSSSENFSATGIFSLTRHPWYLGSLLFLWSIFPEYSRSVFIAVLILSLYLVVGTVLEERKILREHGDSYRRYQQQVSMLFPWKWLKARLKR